MSENFYQAWPAKANYRWLELLIVLSVLAIAAQVYYQTLGPMTVLMGILGMVSLWARLQKPKPMFEIRGQKIKISEVELHIDQVAVGFIYDGLDDGRCIVLETNGEVATSGKTWLARTYKSWRLNQHLFGKKSVGIHLGTRADYDAHVPAIRLWLGSKFRG